MKLKMTILAENSRKEKKWTEELCRLLAGTDDITFQSAREIYGFESTGSNPEVIGQILLIDQEILGKSDEKKQIFEEWIKKIDRKSRAVFLLSDEKSRDSSWI